MGIFSEIPRHALNYILRKLGFTDCVKSKQCSQESLETAESFKHRLPVNIEEITVNHNSVIAEFFTRNCRYMRYMIVDLLKNDITKDDRMIFQVKKFRINSPQSDGIRIEDFFKDFHMRAEHFVIISIGAHVDPSTISDFINRFQVKKLLIHCYNSLDHLKSSDLNKLEEIKFAYSPMDESSFLRLEVAKFTLDPVNTLTPLSINTFLKQWVEAKRRIVEVVIGPLEGEHFEILKDLAYSLHFSYENSARVNLCEYCKLGYFYSLTNVNGQTLFVAIERPKNVKKDTWRLVAAEVENEDYLRWIYLKHPDHDPYTIGQYPF